MPRHLEIPPARMKQLWTQAVTWIGELVMGYVGICWNMLEWCFLKQNGELPGGVKKVHVMMSCCHVSKMCHVQAMSTP